MLRITLHTSFALVNPWGNRVFLYVYRRNQTAGVAWLSKLVGMHNSGAFCEVLAGLGQNIHRLLPLVKKDGNQEPSHAAPKEKNLRYKLGGFLKET